jgi:hypothetical protein
MELIDKSGVRQVCDRCHRVQVKISRGTVCDGCRRKAKKRPRYQISESTRLQRDFMRRARAVQAQIRELANGC